MSRCCNPFILRVAVCGVHRRCTPILPIGLLPLVLPPITLTVSEFRWGDKRKCANRSSALSCSFAMD